MAVTARYIRMAVMLLKQIKNRAFMPLKANTPPHSPRIIKFNVQIIQVKRIKILCA
jgi:hypothetical protein